MSSRPPGLKSTDGEVYGGRPRRVRFRRIRFARPPRVPAGALGRTFGDNYRVGLPLPNLPQDASDSIELGWRVHQPALELAGRGIRVFPVQTLRRVVEPGPDGEPRSVLRCTCSRPACENPGKHPVGHLVPHGHNDATTDYV